jgi:hypothetical protein
VVVHRHLWHALGLRLRVVPLSRQEQGDFGVRVVVLCLAVHCLGYDEADGMKFLGLAFIPALIGIVIFALLGAFYYIIVGIAQSLGA